MLPAKQQNISAALIYKIISLPLIIYGIFFAIRIRGLQPAAESGMGEFITAIYFIFGASVSYFMFIIFCLKSLPSSARNSIWWWFVSCFLMLLAFDEIFMIHENLSAFLEVKDVYIFLMYGGLLCILFFTNREKMVKMPSLFFLSLFVFFSGVSVIADTLYGEGCVIVFGKEIGYEQIAETLAALFLSCTFIPIAISELEVLNDDKIDT